VVKALFSQVAPLHSTWLTQRFRPFGLHHLNTRLWKIPRVREPERKAWGKEKDQSEEVGAAGCDKRTECLRERDREGRMEKFCFMAPLDERNRSLV
jgi:hypothetical protein